jgi:hypothetical protein
MLPVFHRCEHGFFWMGCAWSLSYRPSTASLSSHVKQLEAVFDVSIKEQDL